METLKAAIRRECRIVYGDGYNAGHGGSLATEEQSVDTAVQQIATIVERWTLTREGINHNTLLGYEAGLLAREVKGE